MTQHKTPKQSEQYTGAEAKRRFEAALRGARVASPKHKDSVTQKRRGPQQRRIKEI